MLEVKDVHSYYGGAHVLQGVSLTVPESAVVALLGRNGMGKTTLMRSIMGAAPPEVRAGNILYQEQELIGKSPHQIALQGLALVPQGRRIFPSLSVVENLTMSSRFPKNNGNGKKIVWDLDRVYELFPRLAERKKHWGNQLSGGELQMLAIARALMTNPEMLLMDEPSEGLAPVLVQLLRDKIIELKVSGLPIFLVEQNLGLALAVADEVYLMEGGQIVYHGQPEELATNEEIKHKYLGV
jgi:branched-chain amino acid transport system ATP-binding protein